MYFTCLYTCIVAYVPMLKPVLSRNYWSLVEKRPKISFFKWGQNVNFGWKKLMQFWPRPCESWPRPWSWPRPRPLLASLSSLVSATLAVYSWHAHHCGTLTTCLLWQAVDHHAGVDIENNLIVYHIRPSVCLSFCLFIHQMLTDGSCDHSVFSIS